METDAKKLFQFSPAASFWASFKYFVAVLFGIGYIAALPVQLLLHRRMGERYLNIVVLLISMLAGLFIVTGGQAAALIVGRWVKAPGWWNVTASFISVATVMLIVPAFFFLHRYVTWRRDRGGDIVHSRSWGVPFYLVALPGDGKPAAIEPAFMPAINADAPPLHVVAELISEFRQGWRQMLRERSQGIVPQGWVPWIVVTVFHPLALIVLGALLLVAHFGLGLTLIVGGAGMFTQGRISAAFFREQVLDHRDSKIEQEAWVQIVQGKPHTGEQHGYAIPVASRALTQEVRNSIVARLIGAEPRYAAILKPVQQIEPKPNEPSSVESDRQYTGGVNGAAVHP